MNLVSMSFAQQYRLQLHPLLEIGFAGLAMRYADNREIIMQYFIKLDVSVEGLWRKIRCFVAPDTSGSVGSSRISLLLSLPWLWSVNARFSIKQSRIDIGNASIREAIRSITGPELVFCRDHNLILYPKSVLIKATPKEKPRRLVKEVSDEEEDSSDNSGSESDSGDDLSDIEEDNPPQKQDF
jgi:hypothetical protein